MARDRRRQRESILPWEGPLKGKTWGAPQWHCCVLWKLPWIMQLTRPSIRSKETWDIDILIAHSIYNMPNTKKSISINDLIEYIDGRSCLCQPTVYPLCTHCVPTGLLKDNILFCQHPDLHHAEVKPSLLHCVPSGLPSTGGLCHPGEEG